jgi:hypothetical protein
LVCAQIIVVERASNAEVTAREREKDYQKFFHDTYLHSGLWFAAPNERTQQERTAHREPAK